jgi:transcriptional regulator with XRE-family HTH domain
MNDAMAIPAAVGSFLARTRRDHGFTLDQIARAARSHGASWSASSISNIERGQASVTLQTMTLLALALGDLLGRPLALADLLGDAVALSLAGEGGGHVVARSWMDSVLSGGPVVMDTSHQTGSDVDAEFDEELEDEVLRRMRDSRGRDLPQLRNSAQLEQMLDESQLPRVRSSRARAGSTASSLAEERAAKKLGIDSNQLRRLALEQWGHSIEDESALRAGANSTPQARGRATRVLVEELRDSMKGDR